MKFIAIIVTIMSVIIFVFLNASYAQNKIEASALLDGNIFNNYNSSFSFTKNNLSELNNSLNVSQNNGNYGYSFGQNNKPFSLNFIVDNSYSVLIKNKNSKSYNRRSDLLLLFYGTLKNKYFSTNYKGYYDLKKQEFSVSRYGEGASVVFDLTKSKNFSTKLQFNINAVSSTFFTNFNGNTFYKSQNMYLSVNLLNFFNKRFTNNITSEFYNELIYSQPLYFKQDNNNYTPGLVNEFQSKLNINNILRNLSASIIYNNTLKYNRHPIKKNYQLNYKKDEIKLISSIDMSNRLGFILGYVHTNLEQKNIYNQILNASSNVTFHSKTNSILAGFNYKSLNIFDELLVRYKKHLGLSSHDKNNNIWRNNEIDTKLTGRVLNNKYNLFYAKKNVLYKGFIGNNNYSFDKAISLLSNSNAKVITTYGVLFEPRLNYNANNSVISGYKGLFNSANNNNQIIDNFSVVFNDIVEKNASSKELEVTLLGTKKQFKNEYFYKLLYYKNKFNSSGNYNSCLNLYNSIFYDKKKLDDICMKTNVNLDSNGYLLQLGYNRILNLQNLKYPLSVNTIAQYKRSNFPKIKEKYDEFFVGLSLVLKLR